MENFQKFEGIDYVNNFAKRINSVHQLVSNNLQKFLSNNAKVIDLGGGPGVGASIIDKLGIKAQVLNIEPSNNAKVLPDFSYVSYAALQFSFGEALNDHLPWQADVILMVSAAHEIALSNRKTNEENKRLFFQDIQLFIKKNAKAEGLFCIGFPNYKPHVNNQDIIDQQAYTAALLEHSHPPEEFFTVQEFSNAFASKPIKFEQKPMVLSNETENETKLMANFAAFKVRDILSNES
ncbi:MAG: hypothetical protein PF517_10930 [Salinivirgaceae bacterium]|jgi:hypothetical protein|nr:hypothetical protein [Salinivirgaceae bacterium]